MVWLNPSGTPEGNERCRRLNQISSNVRQANDDQVVAHIREIIRHWRPEELDMLRNWANARRNFEKHYRFYQLKRACINIPDDTFRWPGHHENEYPPPTPPQYLSALNSVDQLPENSSNRLESEE